MNPTEAKSFIWTVFFCIVVVCVVAVLMSFPAKASEEYLITQDSTNTNGSYNLQIQEFSYATTTRISGVLFPLGDGGNLTVCKGSIESASDWEDLYYLQQCMNGASDIVLTGYHNCTATTTGNYCRTPIVIQANTMYYFVLFNDSWEVAAGAKTDQWLYNGSPEDPYANHDACWVQMDWDGLGNNRGACNYFDISWAEQFDGDMTFKVVYDPDLNTPLYNASDVFGNLNANLMADATCMPTHCYRNDTCYVDILYNDLAEGSDLYLGWDIYLEDGVNPSQDGMSYAGTLTGSGWGGIWDQPSLHYKQFVIQSANEAFGSTSAMTGQINTLRVCDYVDANNDWFGDGNGDPDNLDTLGCDCEISYHNEEGGYASNLFYETITPQECASSTVGSCGLTDVECGLKKAAHFVICPEEDKVTEFYNEVQKRRDTFPYNFVASVQGGLTELRATSSASIPLLRIGKNGVRQADSYLITPSRWLDPKLDDFRYWYFKIIRWMMAVLFMAYFFNRLFNMITGGTKTIAEDELARSYAPKRDKRGAVWSDEQSLNLREPR